MNCDWRLSTVGKKKGFSIQCQNRAARISRRFWASDPGGSAQIETEINGAGQEAYCIDQIVLHNDATQRSAVENRHNQAQIRVHQTLTVR
jgi:hypothetical protein